MGDSGGFVGGGMSAAGSHILRDPLFRVYYYNLSFYHDSVSYDVFFCHIMRPAVQECWPSPCISLKVSNV